MHEAEYRALCHTSVNDVWLSVCRGTYKAVLAYALPTCSSNLVTDSRHLVLVHRLVTRLIASVHHLPVEERL